MNYFYHSVLKAYPELKTTLGTLDAEEKAQVWNGETFVDFEYDRAKVEAANKEVIVEFQWADLRKHRDKLLAETDWLGNSDVTMSDEWKTYRQALRDLPANTADPANPTYPTKPN